MRQKSLAVNAFYNIVYKVLNIVFPIISSAYIARILMADGVGRTSAASNNVSYFIILATLGIPAYGLREVAKIRDDQTKINALYSELLIINALLTSCSYVLFLILLKFLPLFDSDFLLYFIYGFTILLNYINVDWLYQGIEEYKYIAIRSSVIKLLSLLALFAFVRSKNDIYFYALINVIAQGGNYFFNIIHSKKYVHLIGHNLNLRRHIKPLLYLALCSISTELYARMDITMLDIMKPDNVVGYYSNSQKLINTLITFLVAVTAVFLPRLSYYYEFDKEKFQKLVNLGFTFSLIISIPSCVGMIMVAKPVVLILFGTGFSDSINTIRILSFMIPLKCIGDIICYQVMMSAGKEKILMYSYTITMIVNFINNALMIPRWGAEGASVASVISEILAFVFVWHYSRKIVHIRSAKVDVLSVFTSSIVMGIVLFFVNRFVDNLIINLLMDIIVGAAVYLILNLLMKNKSFLEIYDLIRNRRTNRGR